MVALMSDLERFINDAELFDVDPLIKMALIHHQFESIHPFYDGNGGPAVSLMCCIWSKKFFWILLYCI